MSGEGFSSFPSTAGHSAALAARTLHAVPHDAPSADFQFGVVSVNANGAQPHVVSGTSLWWCPLPHERSVTPLGSVVNQTIIL